MFSGLSKVAIFDPATGTTVQLDKVSPDGEFKKEPMRVEDGSGGYKYAGDDASFEFDSFDPAADFTQLETWMENETDIQLVTYGIDEHILWYENSKVNVKKNLFVPVGQRNSFRVSVAQKGGQLSISSGNNLMFAKAGWADAGSNGQADGYTFDSDANLTKTFTSEQQVLTAGDSVADGEMYIPNFIYPIVGVNFNFFINIIANTMNSGVIKVIEKTFAGAAIATTQSTTLTEVLAISTEATQYKFDVYVLDTGVFDNTDEITLDAPYLGNKSSGIIKY